MNNLHRLLQRLADAKFEFVVVGGFAGVLHGSFLVTNDIDICAVLSSENVRKPRQALAELHPTHRITQQKLSFLKVPEEGQPIFNLYLETDDGILDVLSNVAGVGDLRWRI